MVRPITIITESGELFESTGSVDSLDPYYASDFVRHGRRDRTFEEYKVLLADIRIGVPDMNRTVLDVLEDGDRVAVRWESTGTHLGPLFGALATGRSILARGITISRVEDGKIAEEWGSWDELSVLHDIGIMPIDR